MLGSISVIVISLFLLFSPDSTYLAWRKFAVIAIPIGAIILYLVPADTSGGFAPGPDLSKEAASWIVSVLFLVISLGIIVKQRLKKA